MDWRTAEEKADGLVICQHCESLVHPEEAACCVGNEHERLRADIAKIADEMTEVVRQSREPHSAGSIFGSAVEDWANRLHAQTGGG